LYSLQADRSFLQLEKSSIEIKSIESVFIAVGLQDESKRAF
jgi:hypothetical protein